MKDARLISKVQRGLSFIAAWQLLSFVLLILLAWVNEIMDLSSVFFHTPHRPPDIMRGSLATAGILLAAVITVGNTYLQQRRIVRGLLTICSYCKKIRIESEVWQQIEEYMHKRSPVNFTHSVCPDCLAREKQNIQREVSAGNVR